MAFNETFEDKMFFPTTYHYVKDAVCRVDRCVNEGECGVCQYGLLRAYAARDSNRIDHLMKEVEALVEDNKKLREELSDTKKLNKELTKELSSFKTGNSTLTKDLAECCDSLWYYFGKIGGTWSNFSCKNVYDTAKYYLDRAKKGEDDGGKY